MLLGELATFKLYKRKNNLFAKQMAEKFIIRNDAPKKTFVGEAGDYVALDDNGDAYIIKQKEFEETYILEGESNG